MYNNGDKVLYKQQRCACVGGGWTELHGTIVGTIDSPNGKFYKVTTDYQGTFVVPSTSIIALVDAS